MEQLKTGVLWVILILSGILYSYTKKKRNEALMREMTGNTEPEPKEEQDNYLFEGLILGLILGWLVAHFGIAEMPIAMSFGVIVGFCGGLVLKKKPKEKKQDK